MSLNPPGFVPFRSVLKMFFGGCRISGLRHSLNNSRVCLAPISVFDVRILDLAQNTLLGLGELLCLLTWLKCGDATTGVTVPVYRSNHLARVPLDSCEAPPFIPEAFQRMGSRLVAGTGMSRSSIFAKHILKLPNCAFISRRLVTSPSVRSKLR